MIYPSIDKLQTIVPSKFTLVYVSAIRSKQMNEKNHYQMPEEEYKCKRGVGRALEELERGLITVNTNSNK